MSRKGCYATETWSYPVFIGGGAETVSEAALTAADAYDAAHNVHRVVLSDATVERAARALIVSIWKIPNAWEIASQRERDSLTTHARITLAASMEAIK